MRLSWQLLILIILLLLMVFCGTFFINVQNSRDYLASQLQSHAQDAATSLGLSISPHLAEHDLATVTSMTDAIFDSGYYRQVEIKDMEGKPLVSRQLPLQFEGVPQWFVNSFTLDTPMGSATVMAGWIQAGTVTVRSHPGFAYRQLWESAVDSFWWFLLSVLIVLFIGLVALRALLKPLKAIEHQANAIVNREFPEIDDLPRTRDLRRIVEAMNRMSRKVRKMLGDAEKLADGLRRKAYQHPVSGLINKGQFIQSVNHLLEAKNECATALLALIELKSFKAYNETYGYQAGDALLQTTAERLGKVASAYPQSLLGHLSGADFALFVPDLQTDDTETLGVKLTSALVDLRISGLLESEDIGHVGITCYTGEEDLSPLLARADSALRRAQVNGPNQWYLAKATQQREMKVRNAGEWRRLLLSALEQHTLTLQYQDVFRSADGELIHKEVYVRMSEPDGRLLNAGEFLPQAERFGLTAEIDRVVMERIFEHLMYATVDERPRYAINLSVASLEHETFQDWLKGSLETHKAVADRLIFEFPEYAALNRLPLVREFIAEFSRFGVAFSLDHFGRGQGAFGYLRSLRVDYLKIDGSFLRTLVESEDNQFFIQALVDIAHGLDIEVIAESIETETVWAMLRDLHVDGAQGYYLGRPA